MLTKTIQAVRKREELAEDVDRELYKWIEGHPGLNIYALAKSIGWSHGKAYSSVKRLEDDGLVKIEKAIINGRSAARYFDEDILKKAASKKKKLQNSR